MRNLIFTVSILFTCNSIAQQTVDVKTFQSKTEGQSVQLLDVRTAKEYQSGHLAGALQADWNNKVEFEERTKSLNKNETVYIYCLGGGRSAAAMDFLLKQGFNDIINMAGGINAWNQASLPVETVQTIAQISKEDFLHLLASDGKTIVDFGATWCPPCKKMAPIVDELKAEGQPIINIDGGEQQAICKELSITSFPTFIVFENGKELKRFQGVATKEEILELLK